jgi:hypothetical protein
VEITDSAFPVNEHPFKRSTAFLLGNEVIIEFMIVGLFLFFVSMEKLLAFYGNGWCGSGFLNRAWLQGTGLSTKECEICDFFVYIPQYGQLLLFCIILEVCMKLMLALGLFFRF